MQSPPNLVEIFRDLNNRFFDGKLEVPHLFWNRRMRTTAGRFQPGNRKQVRSIIDVASYLLEEPNGLDLVRDTVGHEMIHYWLWSRRKKYGHTEEFYQKMNEMGVSRYNPVPRRRPHKYLYRCPQCQESFPARRRLKSVACLACCKKHNDGYFDRKFKLYLDRNLSS